MKNKKDLFDLFRDNEHKLDERPDSMLWDRLEGRLDQSSEAHRAPSRNGWKQWMSMAGVMLALIVVISVVNMMLKGENGDRQSAENKGIMPTLEMEEIGIFSDKGPNYTVGEYQKMLARLNTSPILEGDPNKKIRIQESVFASLSERSKQQIASVDKILRAEEAVNAKKAGPKEIETKFKDSKRVVSAEANEMVKAEAIEVPRYANENVSADHGSSDDAVYADMVMDEAATTSAPPPAAANMEMEESVAAGAMDLNVMKNKVSVAATEAQAGIQQFEWLLGKWEAPGSDQIRKEEARSDSRAKKKKSESAKMTKDMGQNMIASNRSVEEWKPLDEFTIEGQGYLVVNGDTTFTESMQIKKIGSDLYYVLALDDSGNQVKYRLKTYTEKGAVFENEEVAFPNQVILQRDFSNSNFTTLLQNKTPAQINTEQQEYFQNRNMIRSEQVKRVMNRVEN